MSVPYASGRNSYANCDRCGLPWPYPELKRQFVNQKDTGLRVCPDCWDIDHEQWLVGKYPIIDPQALQYARPDLNTDRGLFGFNPVLGNVIVATVGQVRVTVT